MHITASVSAHLCTSRPPPSNPLAEREAREGRLGPCKSSISLRKFLQQLPLCACHATNVMGTCIRELCVVTAVHMCMYVSEGDGDRS